MLFRQPASFAFFLVPWSRNSASKRRRGAIEKSVRALTKREADAETMGMRAPKRKAYTNDNDDGCEEEDCMRSWAPAAKLARRLSCGAAQLS